MTLRDTLTSAIQQLTVASIPSPRMNAELLLMHTLDCDRAHLYAHPERELTAEQAAQYDEVLARRRAGMPAQYITGHQEFWGMDFIVTSAVLIPRPETEHVIETVLPLARKMARPSIVDVGTGSGCIAVALAKELPAAQIHAVDISSEALSVARSNAGHHQLEGRILFYEKDLLAGFGAGHFDFVVSNPPYVGESEQDEVQLEVRKFEPRSAVFAGPTGLEVIERLIPQAHTTLKPGGWLIMEISGTIAGRVEQLLHNWAEMRIVPDLQNIPRVVAARRMSE